jgi:hypothetical protein
LLKKHFWGGSNSTSNSSEYHEVHDQWKKRDDLELFCGMVIV